MGPSGRRTSDSGLPDNVWLRPPPLPILIAYSRRTCDAVVHTGKAPCRLKPISIWPAPRPSLVVSRPQKHSRRCHPSLVLACECRDSGNRFGHRRQPRHACRSRACPRRRDGYPRLCHRPPKTGGRFDIRQGHCPDDMPFDGTRYDLVCLFDCLEHIGPDVASLQCVRDRLAPGGAVLVFRARERMDVEPA